MTLSQRFGRNGADPQSNVGPALHFESIRIALRRVMAAAILAAISIPTFAACDGYDFDFEATPAFLPPSRIQVHAHQARSLTIDYADRVERMNLSDIAAEQFCISMRQIIKIEQTGDKRGGFDGISVRGRLKPDGAAPYEFDFWSPDRNEQPRDFAIADAVFTLLESITPSCELNIYLERLASYFHFGLPARVIRGPPLTVRFYGGLSINHADDLAALLSGLPVDVPLQVDMTNVGGIGTLLYPKFQILLLRDPPAKWLAYPSAVTRVQELGAKSNQIEVQKMPYCLTSGTRFSRQ
jgi:hypothetical protein